MQKYVRVIECFAKRQEPSYLFSLTQTSTVLLAAEYSLSI